MTNRTTTGKASVMTEHNTRFSVGDVVSVELFGIVYATATIETIGPVVATVTFGSGGASALVTVDELERWNPAPSPRVEDYSTPAVGAAVSTPDGTGTMAGVTGHLYAVDLPDGSTMGYAPSDVSPLPAYSFYVGSTDTHDAHTNAPHAVDAFPDALCREVFNARIRTYGVWEGETEATAIYEARLADDATAQRIAYAIAILTGNDCVMVTRDAFKGESDRAFDSTARYRVSEEIAVDGNRTLRPGIHNLGVEFGYRFTPDVKGSHVAYLVHRDASVTPVGA